jgi:hypothetical protein
MKITGTKPTGIAGVTKRGDTTLENGRGIIGRLQ